MFIVDWLHNGRSHTVSVDGSKEVIAGSSNICDLKIRCTIVSKKHFVFRYIPHYDVMLVKNQGRNPTFLGQQQMLKDRWISLEEGDIIKIGLIKRSNDGTELKIIKCNTQESENVSGIPISSTASSISSPRNDERENRSALAELNNVLEKSIANETGNTLENEKNNNFVVLERKIDETSSHNTKKKINNLNCEKSNSSVERKEVANFLNLDVKNDDKTCEKPDVIGHPVVSMKEANSSNMNSKNDNATCEKSDIISRPVVSMNAANSSNLNSKNDNTACEKSDIVNPPVDRIKMECCTVMDEENDTIICEKCDVNGSVEGKVVANSSSLETKKEAEDINVAPHNSTKGKDKSLLYGQGLSKPVIINDENLEEGEQPLGNNNEELMFSDDDEEGIIYSQRAEVTYISSGEEDDGDNIGLEAIFNKSQKPLVSYIKEENEGESSFSKDTSRDTLNPLSDDNDCKPFNYFSNELRNRRPFNDVPLDDVICISDDDSDKYDSDDKQNTGNDYAIKDVNHSGYDSEESVGPLVIVDAHSMENKTDGYAKKRSLLDTEIVNKNISRRSSTKKDEVNSYRGYDSDESFGPLVIVDKHSVKDKTDGRAIKTLNTDTGVVNKKIPGISEKNSRENSSSTEKNATKIGSKSLVVIKEKNTVVDRSESSTRNIPKLMELKIPPHNKKIMNESNSVISAKKNLKRTMNSTVSSETINRPLSDTRNKEHGSPSMKKLKRDWNFESNEEPSESDSEMGRMHNLPLAERLNKKQSCKNTVNAHSSPVKSSKSKHILKIRNIGGKSNKNKKKKTASQEQLLIKRREKLKEITLVKGSEKLLPNIEPNLVKNKISELPKVKVTNNNRGSFLSKMNDPTLLCPLKKDSKASLQAQSIWPLNMFQSKMNKNERKEPFTPKPKNIHQYNRANSSPANIATNSLAKKKPVSILKTSKIIPSMYKEYSDQPLAIHPKNKYSGRKMVSFDRNNIKTFEIERKELVNSWPTRTYSKVTQMTDDYKHSKILTIDHIGYWQVEWLLLQKNHKTATLPVYSYTKGNGMGYENANDYERMMKYILYNELWHDLFNQWHANEEVIRFQTQLMREKPRNHILIVQSISLLHSKNAPKNIPGKTKKPGTEYSYENRLISVQAYKVIEDDEDVMKDELMPGQVTIVNLKVTQNADKTSRTVVFAYICEVNKYRVNINDKAMVKEYGLDRYYRPKYIQHVSFYYSQRNFNVIIGSEVKMMILTTIDTHIRQFQALSLSKHSALRNALILPDRYDFSFNCHRAVVEKRSLTTAQHNAVTGCVSMCYSDNPKIALVEGLAGSGKTKVVIDSILDVLNNPCIYPCTTKILLCVGYDYAIDDIITRLTREESFRKGGKPINLTAYSSTIKNPKSTEYFLWNKANKLMKDINWREEIENEIRFTQSRINALKLSCSTSIMAKPNITRSSKLSLERYLKTLDTQMKMRDGNMKPTGTVADKLKFAAEWEVLDKSDLIITDMRSCWSEIFENHFVPSTVNGGSPLTFTTCIIDDANQCSEIYAMIPTMLDVKHLILVGDDKQLSPNLYSQVVKSKNYDRSILARLLRSNQKNQSRIPVFRLNDQMRTSREIFSWLRGTFYSHFTTALEGNSKRCIPPPFKNLKPYVLINHNYEPVISECNDDEALLIMRLVSFYLKEFERNTLMKIGILVPCRGQFDNCKSIFNDMLACGELPMNNKILVKYVGQSLGREYDVVFVSLTEANPCPDLNEKWINVAFTRATYSLVVCGNFTGLKHDRLLGSLYDNGRKRKVVCDINVPPNELSEDQLKSLIYS